MKRSDKIPVVQPEARADTLACVHVAVSLIDPTPDNPRSGRFTEAYLQNDPGFREHRASIRANSQGGTTSGNIQPVLLRPDILRPGRYQLIAGERRWRAAGLEGVPTVLALIRAGLTDRQAFELTVLENRHEPLTPLEAAKAVATLMDRYQEDAASVAATMGLTEPMVRKLAQIERGLIPLWKKTAVEDQDYAHWTAAHWVQIARLPVALQEYWHNKIDKDYRFDPHAAKADDVAEWLQTEKLFLVKAPFETAGCKDCDKRTDAVHLLLWTEGDQMEALPEEARCLDPKCWERKCCRKVKEEFKAKAVEVQGTGGSPVPVPLSLIESGMKNQYDYIASRRYTEKLKPVKKAFGRDLVTADRITVVKEGTPGAVPGIVVAGKGKGSVKWVKIAEPKKENGRGGAYRPSAQELARKVDQDRWGEAIKIVCGQIAAKNRERPAAAMILLIREQYQAGTGEFKKITSMSDRPEAEIVCWLAERAWRDLQRSATNRARYISSHDKDRWMPVAQLLGIDAKAIYAALKAEEKKETTKSIEPESPAKRSPGQPRKNQGIEVTPEVAAKGAALASGATICDSGCNNCAQPNCNGRQTEYASHATPPKKLKRGRARNVPAKPAVAGSGGGPLGASCGGDAATCKVGCEPCLAEKGNLPSAKRTCRVCGCTEDNCQQCIERTGKPCHWVAEDLCSACAEP